jgi:OHS family lactose permease-like MFS transporter
MLHGFESSVFLVAGLKYISANFPAYISATVYLIGFQFSKRFSEIFLSGAVGKMYNTLDFRDTYIILGLIALSFTFISIFTLSPTRQRLSQEAVSG